MIAFYNRRGTAETRIKEGKHAIKWTPLARASFQANAARLQLHALAYNFLHTLALPGEVERWSLTSLWERAERTRAPAGRWIDRHLRLLQWTGLLAVCLMCLSRLAGFGLSDPDEGRYAEIPREMLELHDWITPHLGYVNYFEKPPLLYWLVGLSLRLFGTSEWAARLTPALAAIGGVVLTHALGVRLLGRRAAPLAAAVLITSPLYFALSQVLVIDMLLTLCMTAALVFVYQTRRAPGRSIWPLAAAVAAGLGVLAKGPVALVLPGLIGLAFLGARRDARTLGALLAPWPILVFAATAVPWFVLVSLEHPDFPGFFFVREHLYRFATSRVGHPEPFWYYMPVVVGGFFPWTLLVAFLAATPSGRAAFRRVPADARLLLSLWAAVVIVAFTLARAKLSPYVLPAFPALALLTGGWLDRVLDDDALTRLTLGRLARSLARIAAFVLLIGVAVRLLPASLAAELHRDSGTTQAFLVGGTWLALVMLPVAALAAHPRCFERLGGLGVVLLLAGGIACGEMTAVGARSTLHTSRTLAAVVQRYRTPDDSIIVYEKLMQGLPFYTGSRVVQFEADGLYDELQFGASQAPDRAQFFWSHMLRLAERWRSGQRTFIVTGAECERELEASLAPAPQVLVRDGDRVVLVNFPALPGR